MHWSKIADCTFNCKFFFLFFFFLYSAILTPYMLHKHTLVSCRGCLYAIIQYKQRCMSLLSYTLTFSCLCSTVLSICCVGRCVRYTCWQTRFLCVRLSGSGCLTPPVSLVWRQVRGGHICTVPSDPIPSDPSYCHGNSLWKP